MDRIGIDFQDIAIGLLVSFAGAIAVAISLFRLKSRDYSLLNFGLLCFVYGIQWLVEIPTMKALVGFPFTAPYFHALLTYALPIPLSAFLVATLGPGVYHSVVWVFRSTIAYAIAAVGYDLIRSATHSDPSINSVVVLLWCSVGMVNLIFLKTEHQTEVRLMRIAFFLLLFSFISDNLGRLGVFSRDIQLQHYAFLVLCLAMGYVATRHFISNEQKLLAIEQELAIARRIQHSNLPAKLPPSDGLDIAAKYVPMSAVAGDFYDIQVKERTSVGVLIADVSGHGVGAALIGSMLKIGFASQAENLADPARVLEGINRVLQGKIEDSFVTACSVFIDLEHGRIRYANAGHPPPILWRKSRKEKFRLSHAGTILGPFPNTLYDNEDVCCEHGDRLVLYTDGLVEARNKSGDLFGDDRMEAIVEAHSSDTADASADRIIQHLMTWSGRSGESSLEDDLTLIIIDVLAGPRGPHQTMSKGEWS